jgi:ATP-binding cassette subfamily B (MDR/TAP) protein 1
MDSAQTANSASERRSASGSGSSDEVKTADVIEREKITTTTSNSLEGSVDSLKKEVAAVSTKTKSKKSKNATKDDDKPDPFVHLPEAEAEVLRRQIAVDTKKAGFGELYRYATAKDKFILVLGLISSIIVGAALPMFTLVFGSLTQEFTDFFTSPNPDPETFQSKINHFTLYFLYLGLGIIVFGVIDTYIFVERGEVLTGRIRENYLKSVLRQNIAYFDHLGAGEVTTRITNDTNAIQEGISEKAGIIISGFSTFIAALVIGFAKSWKLACILLSVVATIAGDMTIGSVFIIKYQTKSTQVYGEGSTIAEESLSAIRNTVAFGAQNRLAARFDVKLAETQKYNTLKDRSVTVMVGVIWCCIYLNYALAFYMGSRFIAHGEVNVGTVVTVVMAMMIGAFQLGSIAPSFQAVGVALSSAAKIFEAIDRVPPIDIHDEGGNRLSEVKGHIKLEGVKFIYPSRPDVVVLENMNIEVFPGQTVALVGVSGSGKSTIVGLLERFYEPVAGRVTIDGVDVSTINVKWLRQQLALVSQEPTLFAVSIYENICYGLIGTEYENAPEDVKRELVIEACKLANAWEFIETMSDGLETNVGDRGFLMSGGQKQRIAIARAIISNPKILLLDEATSALDTKSEGIVQEALDRAAKSRTTIVIAHRLSTIKDADKIIVMSKGAVIEQGTHHELLALDGYYKRLVDAQQINGRIADEIANDNAISDPGADTPLQYVIEREDTVELTKTQSQKSLSSVILEKQQTPPEYKQRSVFAHIKMVSCTQTDELRPSLFILLTSASSLQQG